MVTKETVKELFDYNDGKLFRKIKHAGCLNKSGYRIIGINRKYYLEHRLIWLLFNGHFPKEIDHINHIRDDNRIENLREVTRSQNQFNRIKIYGLSKYKGVSWDTRSGKWVVQIQKDGKRKNLGYFDSEEKGAEAYNIEAKKLFGKYANLNIITDINVKT